MVASQDSLIQVSGLSRRYNRVNALDEFSLTIQAGEVVGLVGENGAGKTTLIQHLLGLLKPESGTVSVFGLDPVRNPEPVLSRVGFVSEDRDLPEWLNVDEFFCFSRAFYSQWDLSFESELRMMFELRGAAKIKSLSRGEKARVCLVSALAHRPELLILDEPSAGLDPIVRQDVLSAIIRTVSEEGRTVVFSSHLLDEVQRVADRICMIDRGMKLIDEPIEELFERHRRYSLVFELEKDQFPLQEEFLDFRGEGRQWQVVSSKGIEHWRPHLERLGGEVAASSSASLEEIYIAHTRAHRRSEKLKPGSKKPGSSSNDPVSIGGGQRSVL